MQMEAQRVNPAFPYRIIVEWSDEDRAFVSRVPALNAAAHGDTPEEAIREVVEAARAILESLGTA